MPVHWGPISAWTAGAVAVALLALVEYLRRYFASKDAVAKIEADHKREIARMEREIAGRLERIERGMETNMVTQNDFKQSRERFGERLGMVEERVTEAKSEAKHAHGLSNQASNDVRFLTARMEETISGAIKELKDQVREIALQSRRQG